MTLKKLFGTVHVPQATQCTLTKGLVQNGGPSQTDLFHETLIHEMEILDLSDITLKEKKYNGLKLSVLVISL